MENILRERERERKTKTAVQKQRENNVFNELQASARQFFIHIDKMSQHKASSAVV